MAQSGVSALLLRGSDDTVILLHDEHRAVGQLLGQAGARQAARVGR